MRSNINKEKLELDDYEYQINNLKAKYELKRLEINQLNSKLDEKFKILNEARKAYAKVL